MEDPEDLRRATELWQEAYRHQMDGELDRAVERYQRSIEVYPTAEAHTFMGWALSVQGRLDEATDECRRAIEIDPPIWQSIQRHRGLSDAAGQAG